MMLFALMQRLQTIRRCAGAASWVGHAAQVHADVRLIKSLLYASELSLRFPRVAEVRNDKRPLDIQTIGEIREMVHGNRPDAGGPPAPEVHYRRHTGSYSHVVRGLCRVHTDEVESTARDKKCCRYRVLSCAQKCTDVLTQQGSWGLCVGVSS